MVWLQAPECFNFRLMYKLNQIIKIASLTLIFFSLGKTSFSQSEIKRANHWFFGDSCGVDFSSGLPVVDTNGVLNTLEGCSTISDTSGNLLFYTDGIKVWDSTHTQMPNGYDLHGDWSSLNSTVIVPRPESNNIFYVFTTPAYAGHWTNYTGLKYSIVDMNSNGGLGDVISKNVILLDTATEQLGAVRHANKIDFWVIGRDAINNNFNAFLVSSSGVSSVPIISSTGFSNEAQTTYWWTAVSSLKISPSGCKLACTYPNKDTLEIFDFNNSSGTVGNPITMNILYPWSSCFSPDNNLLYLNSYNYNSLSDKIYQLNLLPNTASGILASKIALSTNETGLNSTMQIGPDGKIYCSMEGSSYLSVINSPNTLGSGCNFVFNGFYLGGKNCQSGIPNFVQSYFVNDSLDYSCSTVEIPEYSLQYSMNIFPNPFISQTELSFDLELNNANLVVKNIFGETVKESRNIYGRNITLYSENLSNGIYFIIIMQDNHTIAMDRLVIIDN